MGADGRSRRPMVDGRRAKRKPKTAARVTKTSPPQLGRAARRRQQSEWWQGGHPCTCLLRPPEGTIARSQPRAIPATVSYFRFLRQPNLRSSSSPRAYFIGPHKKTPGIARKFFLEPQVAWTLRSSRLDLATRRSMLGSAQVAMMISY
jgi:hypothetical protein